MKFLDESIFNKIFTNKRTTIIKYCAKQETNSTWKVEFCVKVELSPYTCLVLVLEENYFSLSLKLFFKWYLIYFREIKSKLLTIKILILTIFKEV